MGGKRKIALVFATCVVAVIVIIWAVVTSLMELADVWYW